MISLTGVLDLQAGIIPVLIVHGSGNWRLTEIAQVGRVSERSHNLTPQDLVFDRPKFQLGRYYTDVAALVLSLHPSYGVT